MSRTMHTLATLGLLVACAAFSVSADAKKTKVLYMNWFWHPSQDGPEQEIVKLFNKTHPDIEVTKAFAGEADSLNDKVLSMLAGGKPPDIVCVPSQHSLRYMKQALLLNLEPFIKSDGFDLSQFKNGSKYFVKPDINAAGTYQLPWGVGYHNMFYNKRAFKEAGLAMPYKGWTTAEFLVASKRMTKDTNGDGKSDTWALDWMGPGFDGWHFIDGGDWVDKKSRAAVDDPAFESALDFMADTLLKHKIVGGSFEQGKAAMTVQWDAYVDKLIQLGTHTRFDWSATWLPRGKGETVSFVWGHSMTIMRGSKQPKQAWEFVKFYYSDEVQRFLAKHFLYPMTKVGVASIATELNPPAPLDARDIVRPSIDTGVVKTVPWWVPGFMDTFNKSVGTAGEVLSGRKSAHQWTTWFKAELDREMLRKAPKR